MANNDPARAALMAKLKQNDIEYLRFELPDLHGISRSKTVPIDKVEGYARDGLNFYGGMHGARHVVQRRAGERPCTRSGTMPTSVLFPDPEFASHHPVARQDGERRLPRLRV